MTLRADSSAVYAVAAIIAALTFGLIGTYRLANTIPSRPKGVPGSAVFLWAPPVGFPGLPRRGWWLSCWVQGERDHCSLSDINGNAEYQGDFLRYGDKRSLTQDELQIDSEKTADIETKLWNGNVFVPIVFLRNGEILIPANLYEDGVRLLQRGRGGTGGAHLPSH